MRRTTLPCTLTMLLLACNDASETEGSSSSETSGIETMGASTETSAGQDTDTDTTTTDTEGDECPSGLLCGTPAMCCGLGEVCLSGACVPECASGVYCAEGCCDDGQVCLAGACETPTGACQDSFDCEIDEFCEPSLDQCLPQPDEGPACTFQPQPGPFNPVLRWSWTGSPILPAHDQVLSVPLVVDAVGDETPEVFIVTHDLGDGACDSYPAYLRMLAGDSGTELWPADVEALSDAGRIALCRTPAVGDIDADGQVEIVAHRFGGGLIAFEPDGSIQWTTTLGDGITPYVGYFAGLATVALADMDNDGFAEVVSGGVIFDHQGRLRSGAGLEVAGNNGFGGANSVIADVDDDGVQELVTGAAAYELDGTTTWANGMADGYTAIADFDDDELPELVVIAGGFARVHDAGTGALLAQLDMPGVGAGGPPTIDDFDGDGLLDFASAVGDSYTIFTFMPPMSLDVLWSVPTLDVSSSRTGSSIFDFEADGSAEVLYNDECYMRVYDGSSGDVLLQFASSSGTAAQYPIAVDVDGDNNTELVVVSDDKYQIGGITPGCPNYTQDESLRHGVFVYGDADDRWVRTRRVWNQHSYHITNVGVDGSIPANEPSSWGPAGFNNYRVSAPGNGVFNAADLQVDVAALLAGACPDAVILRATVRNEGSLGVEPGITVNFHRGSDASGELLASEVTSNALLPGASESIEVQVPLVGEGPHAFHVEVDTDAAVDECLEDNNGAGLDDVNCPAVG